MKGSHRLTILGSLVMLIDLICSQSRFWKDVAERSNSNEWSLTVNADGENILRAIDTVGEAREEKLRCVNFLINGIFNRHLEMPISDLLNFSRSSNYSFAPHSLIIQETPKLAKRPYTYYSFSSCPSSYVGKILLGLSRSKQRFFKAND